MIFKRIFDPKLAQTSYLVGCPASREALLVDPNRDIARYVEAAAEEGLRIAHVTETHIHADFVSGARELAYQSGARLYLSGAGGPNWSYRYAADANATVLKEGDRVRMGTIEMRVLHVPGHTPEHLAFLVTDTTKAAEPMGALTGDFLFVGDVGRPDLLERAVRVTGTMEESARQLYRSLQRFREFPDYLQVWPGHVAGSACGKSLSAVPQSTLGYEKRFNWAFGVANEAEFVRAVLAGQPDPPRYFAEMKRLNQCGPAVMGGIRSPARLPLATLSSVFAAGATVVDTRDAREYARGSIPGTINIPATRTFTTWVGSVVPYDREIYLILADNREAMLDELVRDLAGIGLDRVAGYFGNEVIAGWRDTQGLQHIPSVTLSEAAASRTNGKVLLDVRGAGEWAAGHLPGALNIPVGELDQRLEEIPRNRALIV